MKTYTIVKKPEHLDWTKVPCVEIAHHLESPAVDISAIGQVCYDDTALYVRMAAKETDIRAEYTNLLDAPCEDSCLEFFFCPNPEEDRYFNFEYNPNCCLYLGLATHLKDLVRLIPEFGYPFNPNATRTEDGWEVTYEIPYEFIRRFFPTFKLVSGQTMRANFYKCGDLTKEPHYLAWSKITGEVLSFHRPCDFGLLTFE